MLRLYLSTSTRHTLYLSLQEESILRKKRETKC